MAKNQDKEPRAIDDIREQVLAIIDAWIPTISNKPIDATTLGAFLIDHGDLAMLAKKVGAFMFSEKQKVKAGLRLDPGCSGSGCMASTLEKQKRGLEAALKLSEVKNEALILSLDEATQALIRNKKQIEDLLQLNEKGNRKAEALAGERNRALHDLDKLRAELAMVSTAAKKGR